MMLSLPTKGLSITKDAGSGGSLEAKSTNPSERVAGEGKGARSSSGKSSPCALPCLLWKNGRTEHLAALLLPRRSSAAAAGLRRRL